MGKDNDQFSKFSKEVLNSRPLGAAGSKLPVSPAPQRQVTFEQPNRKQTGRAAGQKDIEEQICFNIDRNLKVALGQLKYESGQSIKQLLVEAIEDLLVKYGKV